MQQVVLTAPDMSCGHCKMTIENAGNALAGVSAITADPDTRKIELSYDEEMVSLEDIKKVLAEAGYPAT